MKKLLQAAVLCIAASFFMTSGANSAEHNHADHKRHEKAAITPANALIDEMRALDSAFRDIVSGVAVNDGHRVLSAIETLHGSMEKTRHALHAGEIKLPRNPQRMKEFEGFDKEFHGELEALAKSAERGDGKEMAALAKRLLDGCVRCHGEFRK